MKCQRNRVSALLPGAGDLRSVVAQRPVVGRAGTLDLQMQGGGVERHDVDRDRDVLIDGGECRGLIEMQHEVLRGEHSLPFTRDAVLCEQRHCEQQKEEKEDTHILSRVHDESNLRN